MFVSNVIYFSCPIALASNIQLNNNGESRHPCLVTDYRGKYAFFIIQYNINCRILVCNLCIMFRMFPFTPRFVENLFQEWMLNFEDICTTLVAMFPYPHTSHKKVICFIDFPLACSQNTERREIILKLDLYVKGSFISEAILFFRAEEMSSTFSFL